MWAESDIDDRQSRPEIATIPNVYSLLLQNQILMQNILHKQSQPIIGNPVRQRSVSATVSKVPNIEPKPKSHQEKKAQTSTCISSNEQYQRQLDELFNLGNTEEDEVSDADDDKQYSEISDNDFNDETSERDIVESDKEVETVKSNETDEQSLDIHDVINSMREFIKGDEKSGPKINDQLAAYVNEGLRTKVNSSSLTSMIKKYEKPENVISLKVPRVNSGESLYAQCTLL